MLHSQSHSVDPALLPTNVRKADFALAFRARGFGGGGVVRLGDVDQEYEGFSGRFTSSSVSPLQDAYTETVALAWVVEVKQPGGDMNEATIQLAILHAAVLRKLRSLMVLTGVRLEMPSLVGWVVVGHKWECFVTSMAADGAIVSLCLGFQGS